MRSLIAFPVICFGVIALVSGCVWSKWEPIIADQREEEANRDTGKGVATAQQLEPDHLLKPGRHELEAPKAGNSFLVWVPHDYKPALSWPVVFCYHVRGRGATFWPFDQITQGRGFIIVGMNYTSSAIVHYDLQWIREEKEFFSEALAIISSRLNIDPDFVFMGGYSEGGFHASFLAERVLDRLAGLIILGAGRHAVDHYPISKRRGIRGKPIFIGVGQYDHQNPHAKNTARFYTRCAADVTFEEWPGVGHRISTPGFPSKMLLKWLEEICTTER